MAKQIQVVITDDIDGGEAHETIAFGLDGSSFEIDLNKLNAARFRIVIPPASRRANLDGCRHVAGE